MTTIRPNVFFIDRGTTTVLSLIDSLKSSFPETPVHAIQANEVATQLQGNAPNIIFFSVNNGSYARDTQMLAQLSQLPSSLVIAGIPENNPQITAAIVDLNTIFFHITKPYNPAEVEFVLQRGLEHLRHAKNRQTRPMTGDQFCGIIGRSNTMQSIYNLIDKVAEDDFTTVLIRGESGTGKELVAKAIHAQSRRSTKNFVPVNCAAIPDELLESELFGHTKGAFTGANSSKQGRIQYADGGTLFLDEIGDMKPNLQAKLLRVIQEKEFEPVGGLQSTPVDTRILAATHCDLEQLVSEGLFREDLYYRLSVIPLNIPPLKSRREDIPLLLNYFIDTYTTARGKQSFVFSKQATEALLRYNWRGNVRELENLVQHMSVLFAGATVELSDLPEKYLLAENQTEEDTSSICDDGMAGLCDEESTLSLASFGSFDQNFSLEEELDFKEMINNFETKLIVGALRATEGNKKEAARLLKLKRTTLLEKIKKKNLTVELW